jgi:transcriptional regulator with PAS, ATPase and Fis domain
MRPIDISKPYLFTREIWQGVSQCKADFISHNISPLKNELMRKEVAESWIRSRKHHLLPDELGEFEPMNANEFAKLKEKNRLMIESASCLLEKFESLITISQYFFVLFEKNGIPLLENGSFEFMPNPEIPQGVGLGIRITERNAGTQAHVLSVQNACPVQLIGPEHYCDVYNENISTAAPIFDHEKKVAGCLLLVAYRNDKPWSKEFHAMQAHSFGWVTSVALVIEKQLELHHQNARLLKSNKTLEATISCLDEAIVTIDGKGEITRANKEALMCFQSRVEDLEGENLASFFEQNSPLVDLIMSGQEVNMINATLITQAGKAKNYLFNSRPIITQNSDKTAQHGSIIRISNIKKINDHLASLNKSEAPFTFDSIKGESPTMLKAKERAQGFAGTDENILLIGASGTGKELFAQAIHNHSRPHMPFVALNCAALPRNLVESELFGYEGGSFTGAERNGRPGKIEQANNGTLFLDEIGDMPLKLQGILLRVLEDKKVMRIGSSNCRNVNFRLVTASNLNLLKAVQEKTFRLDLYYRISGIRINIPPLVERRQDILLLAEFFLDEYSKKKRLPRPSLSSGAKEVLLRYSWPGNVRQLEKAMSYALSVATQSIIEIDQLPEEITGMEDTLHLTYEQETVAPRTGAEPIGQANLQKTEELMIRKVLSQTGYRISEAADILGIGKSTLYKKVKKLGITTR